MKRLLPLAATAYPFLVYFGTQRGYYGSILVLLAGLVAARIYARSPKRIFMATAAAAAILALGSISSRFPLLVPSIINLALLITFTSSLVYPPNMIERIASKTNGDLPAHGKHYCRKVCLVWIGFFFVNGALAFDSAFRSLEWWSLYNGLISYCAIAVVFGIELMCRRYAKRAASAHGLARVLIPGILVPIVTNFTYTANPVLAEGADIALTDIRPNLTPPGPFRSSFTEKRFIAVLSRPLESQGEIRCVPAKGIIWRVTSPISQTSIITPYAILREDSSLGRKRINDSSRISATLLSLLSGDIESAKEGFTVVAHGTKNAWELLLNPKDSLTREVIKSISISGASRPQTITVSHASGDTVVTTFTEPTPLSADEETRVEETLHAAS